MIIPFKGQMQDVLSKESNNNDLGFASFLILALPN